MAVFGEMDFQRPLPFVPDTQDVLLCDLIYYDLYLPRLLGPQQQKMSAQGKISFKTRKINLQKLKKVLERDNDTTCENRLKCMNSWCCFPLTLVKYMFCTCPFFVMRNSGCCFGNINLNTVFKVDTCCSSYWLDRLCCLTDFGFAIEYENKARHLACCCVDYERISKTFLSFVEFELSKMNMIEDVLKSISSTEEGFVRVLKREIKEEGDHFIPDLTDVKEMINYLNDRKIEVPKTLRDYHVSLISIRSVSFKLESRLESTCNKIPNTLRVYWKNENTIILQQPCFVMQIDS